MVKLDNTPTFILPENLRPSDFQYPESYIKYTNGEIDLITPWRFLVHGDVTGEHNRVLGLIQRYPKRKLVPFARRFNSDDVACFNGNEPKKNSEVLLIHDYANPGWELRGGFDSFDEWLKNAIEESYNWHMEDWDELTEEEQKRVLSAYRKIDPRNRS